MSLSSMLVQIDPEPGAEVRAVLAVELARTYDCRLTGLFVAYEPVEMVGAANSPGSGLVFERLLEKVSQDAAASKLIYEQANHLLGASWVAWQQHVGEPVDTLCRTARCHDLTIIGQPEAVRHQGALPADLPAQLAMSAGRPILIVPRGGVFTTLGHKILVGWDGSREAARALSDAMPFLKRAHRVDVVIFNASTEHRLGEGNSGDDVIRYLQWHGVRASVEYDATQDGKIGNLLLERARVLGADLLVMGIYGHSRWREALLGGASHTVLNAMHLPVLMSH